MLLEKAVKPVIRGDGRVDIHGRVLCDARSKPNEGGHQWADRVNAESDQHVDAVPAGYRRVSIHRSLDVYSRRLTTEWVDEQMPINLPPDNDCEPPIIVGGT